MNSGNIATIYPYGKELRQFNNGLVERYKSTNHERDIETNYDNRGARLSDFETVRFLSPDPLEHKFPSLSTYNYVGGNPIIFIDPDGRAMDDYFRKNGEYLYTDNSSTDNIRVINSEESYSMIMNSSADNDSKAKMLKANSEEINAEKISSEAGIKILDHYYEAAGFSSEELKTGGLIKNQERGLLAQFTPSKSKTGELHLEANPDILGFKVKSTSDAINLFKHEHKHIEDFKTGRPSPTNHPEYNALRTQLLDKTWDKTTPSFKQTMYNAYGHYLLQKSDQKKYFNNYGIHKITN